MSLPNIPPHDPNRYRTVDGFEDPAMTNGMRADEARSITNPGAITDEDDFTDFICHLLHLAHSQGHDPLDIHDRALTHFAAEAGHLPTPP